VGAYIFRRLLWMFVVLFGVSLVTFVLMHGVPGGPFDSDKKLPPEIMANLNKKYHLDEPLPNQYISYMAGILLPRITPGQLTQADESAYLINIKLGDDNTFQWMNFGPSYKNAARTVNDIFREQLPVSAQLGVMALLLAMAIGIPLGIIAALNRNRPPDYMAMSMAILGVSVPVIVLGPLLIWIFGVTLKWLPVSGWAAPEGSDWSSVAFWVMPTFALGFGSSALIARLTRASLLEVLHEDYIRTARAKGLPERVVIILHAMKNAMIPVVTIIGPLFAALVTGTFVTETIFGIPGMGKYFIDSITNRDYPVIMGTILLYAFLLVVANLAVDLVYAWLDPRIRYS